jgi:hypothetical protein
LSSALSYSPRLVTHCLCEPDLLLQAALPRQHWTNIGADAELWHFEGQRDSGSHSTGNRLSWIAVS